MKTVDAALPEPVRGQVNVTARLNGAVLLLLIPALAAGCAASPGAADGEAVGEEQSEVAAADIPAADIPAEQTPAEETPAEEIPAAAAPEPSPQVAKSPLLDRTRDSVYDVVTATAQTVDNIFGSADVTERATVSRGRIAIGGQWDEREGAKERLRLKARFALPALKDRTSLLIGRGDANDVVDGTDDDNIDTLPERFNDFDDEDWLVGIGYSRDRTLRRGWDFGVGVKVTTPLEPYVRATFHRNKSLGERWLWRLRPRAFWQSQRGAGVSLLNTFDYAAHEDWLFRWWTIVVAEEEVEGLAWTSKFTAYHNLSKKTAFSYGIYASGETEYEVREKDFGVELRFRRQVSRDWLFLELLSFVNWPREMLTERREANIGVGIEFEMQFGDWPGRPHD